MEVIGIGLVPVIPYEGQRALSAVELVALDCGVVEPGTVAVPPATSAPSMPLPFSMAPDTARLLCHFIEMSLRQDRRPVARVQAATCGRSTVDASVQTDESGPVTVDSATKADSLPVARVQAATCGRSTVDASVQTDESGPVTVDSATKADDSGPGGVHVGIQVVALTADCSCQAVVDTGYRGSQTPHQHRQRRPAPRKTIHARTRPSLFEVFDAPTQESVEPPVIAVLPCTAPRIPDAEEPGPSGLAPRTPVASTPVAGTPVAEEPEERDVPRLRDLCMEVLAILALRSPDTSPGHSDSGAYDADVGSDDPIPPGHPTEDGGSSEELHPVGPHSEADISSEDEWDIPTPTRRPRPGKRLKLCNYCQKVHLPPRHSRCREAVEARPAKIASGPCWRCKKVHYRPVGNVCEQNPEASNPVEIFEIGVDRVQRADRPPVIDTADLVLVSDYVPSHSSRTDPPPRSRPLRPPPLPRSPAPSSDEAGSDAPYKRVHGHTPVTAPKKKKMLKILYYMYMYNNIVSVTAVHRPECRRRL